MKTELLIVLAVAVAAPITTSASEAIDILWECPKTFTMSSKAGIVDRYNGTDYIRYIEGESICDLKEKDSDECYFEYKNLVENDGAAIGFIRQKGHPNDTQVIVLDIRNSRFYKTFQQDDLRVTIFGECQDIGENRLQVSRSRKDDALALMGASLLVPGIAAYCNKNVIENRELIEAATNWNRRNNHIMERIIHAVETEGGLTKQQKRTIDRFALFTIKNAIEKSGNSVAYCNDAVEMIDSELLDLDRRSDISPQLDRVMGK